MGSKSEYYDLDKLNFGFQKIVAAVGIILLLTKFFAYHLTGSVAILTDATESIVNVVAAFVGLYSLYLSCKPADSDHPFGHGKVELISATMEGSMISFAGAVILYESLQSLVRPGEISDIDSGLVLIVIAALVNYAVGRTAISKGTKNRSPALVASGRHLCSDTYSSVGISIGLVVVYAAQRMGIDARWLDSSIAIVFGLIILLTGVRVVKSCMDDVMDRVDRELLDGVADAVISYRHNDWIDMYCLRMIKYGPKIFVDVHVVFPRDMTVEEIENEKRELDEAIEIEYGGSVELSMTPVPCRGYNCSRCSRQCGYREEGFVELMEWNPDNLSSLEPHCRSKAPRADPEGPA